MPTAKPAAARRRTAPGRALNNFPQIPGFTLMEVLLVLAILGILFALAIPQFAAFRSKQQLRQALLSVSQQFNLSSSQSLERNRSHQLTLHQGPSELGRMVLQESGNPSTTTATLENGAYIGQVKLGSVPAPTPTTVTFDGRGRPNLSVPLEITINLGPLSGAVRLLPTGKTLIL